MACSMKVSVIMILPSTRSLAYLPGQTNVDLRPLTAARKEDKADSFSVTVKCSIWADPQVPSGILEAMLGHMMLAWIDMLNA